MTTQSTSELPAPEPVRVQPVVVPSVVEQEEKTWVITATVTLRCHPLNPSEKEKVFHRRKDSLDAWFKRHWKEIETEVPSLFDDIGYELDWHEE